MTSFLVFIFSLFAVSISLAQTPKEVVEKIPEIQKSVQMAQPCIECDLAKLSTPICNEQMVCDMMRSSSSENSIYLYQNESKEKYVNSFLADLPYPDKCEDFTKETKKIIGEVSYLTYDDYSDAVEKGGEFLKKWNDRYEAAKKKWDPKFAKTKKKVLQLLNSYKTTANKSQIENAIARIEKVQLRLPTAEEMMASRYLGIPTMEDDEEFKHPEVEGTDYLESCLGPNAFFDHGKMEVVICPGWFEVPEGMMLDILAHELGHGFDPCNMSTAIIEENGTYKAKISNGTKLENQLIDPLKFKDFPLKNIVTCMADPKAVNIPFVSAKEAMDLEEARIKVKLKEFEKEKNKSSIKIAKEIIKEIKGHKKNPAMTSEYQGSCYGGSRSSLLGEGFSDWVASQIVPAMAAEEANPSRRKQIIIESFLYVAGECVYPKKGTEIYNKLDELYKKCGTSLAKMVKKSREHSWVRPDPHPESSDRVEKLRLVQSEYQQILGCRSEGVRSCK